MLNLKPFDFKMTNLFMTLLLFASFHFSGASAQVAGSVHKGGASYYAGKFHGRRTASGEIFNMHDMTCAHRTLPFGTKLEVTNNANGKKVTVRVNDRGPFHKKRIIDLSLAAAKELDMVSSGVADVTIRVLRAAPKKK